MQTRRHRAVALAAVIALGCSGNEDDSEVNRDAGALVRDGGATVRDGGPYAVDHRDRCAIECVDPGTDHDTCDRTDSELCGRFCREVLSGFSEECGACIAERVQIVYEDDFTCEWNGEFDTGFDECAERCPLNRIAISNEALEQKCSIFCIVDDDQLPQACSAQTYEDCRSRCQAQLAGRDTACVACALGAGLRPRSVPQAGGFCFPEQFGTSGPCEAYCD